jgi:DNA-binding transcriptional ArsR family regulator
VTEPAPVAVVSQTPRAGLLLKPLRLEILARAREPRSAASIATALGLPRQKVNYHVRELARGGFLKRAGRQRKRGLTEQKYVVTARAFVLGPDVLGPMSTDAPEDAAVGDKMSAAYLMTLAGRMQRETGHAWHDAHAAGKRLPVLSIDTTLRFESMDHRARFAQALAQAVAAIVAEHTAPVATPMRPMTARPFRLVLGCYPIPKKDMT